jgi:Periplasmic component of the Tol biopolymer transport system
LRIALILSALLAGVSIPSLPNQLGELRDSREAHLKNVRQLTFGGDNAECYWSFSGKKLIFQSTHGDMKADQIFTMNADGSDVKMVSTGKGRTTCSYFLKGDKEIIFASTHAANPEPPTPPDRSQGYVWGIFDTFAIYRANADGTNLRPLFPKKVGPGVKTGYNAEATVSPDGKRIIFTSTMNGDIDLYTMKPDGTDVRQVTNTLGYDGGAYFSPDNKMIVWRAGRPKTEQQKADYLRLLKANMVRPTEMELFVANADGSSPRQVTHNGKANFAPFFTPDGKRIIFASNMDDPRGRNFELYIIGVDGSGLERITYGDQFDAFPMFSPDGKKLVWASNRHGKNHETNIFVADWAP